jgi:hypothetical protein
MPDNFTQVFTHFTLKYRSVNDIVRPIRQIVRRQGEPLDILSDLRQGKFYTFKKADEYKI